MQKILDNMVKSIQVETDILDSNGMIVASSDKSIGGISPIVRSFSGKMKKPFLLTAIGPI